MMERLIKKYKRQINVEKKKFKNCGFTYNHYSRKKQRGYKEILPGSDKPLYVIKWTCGKDSEDCPHCKSKMYASGKIRKLKIKIEAIGEAMTLLREDK